MKKTICAALLCALAFSLALAGCGGGGSAADGLAGTEWSLTGVEASGMKVEGELLDQFASSTLRFWSTKFTMTLNDESAEGTYSRFKGKT